MRGVGTQTGNLFSGYLRRLHEGVVPFGATGVGTQALSMWQLDTTDAAAVVEAANYFNAHAQSIRTGDVVVMVTGIGGVLKLKLGVFTSDGVGTVSVALQTTLAG